ncbi:MAG: hypothetical protein P1U87_03335 [Verrucomicrobiales bacterium]|nr:hypothetical protein [Verrucomicrobiales bacterium]
MKLLFLALIAFALIRSAMRFGRDRQVSDLLFFFFWLTLGAANFIGGQLLLVIPILFLVAGSITKTRVPDLDPPDPDKDEKEKGFQLSEPPPMRSLVKREEESEPARESEEGPEGDADPAEALKRIPEFANDCVILGKIHHRVLDYSAASLEELDSMISEVYGETPPLFPEVTIMQLASYTGETIRKELGGEWKQDEDRGIYLDGISDPETKAYPFTKARNRLLEGEGDSLAFFFRALKQVIEKEHEER